MIHLFIVCHALQNLSREILFWYWILATILKFEMWNLITHNLKKMERTFGFSSNIHKELNNCHSCPYNKNNNNLKKKPENKEILFDPLDNWVSKKIAILKPGRKGMPRITEDLLTWKHLGLWGKNIYMVIVMNSWRLSEDLDSEKPLRGGRGKLLKGITAFVGFTSRNPTNFSQ